MLLKYSARARPARLGRRRARTRRRAPLRHSQSRSLPSLVVYDCMQIDSYMYSLLLRMPIELSVGSRRSHAETNCTN